jgi:hypothetical protein
MLTYIYLKIRIIISISNFSGGNAADTKRATNQKSFIRQDQNKAIIRIHLYNGGEFAFNPAKWGKEIIFEKRILQSGANHFTITGASGKKARDPQGYKAQYICIRIVSSYVLSFYRSQNILGCPNFLWQTKKLFTYCGSHKHFALDEKMICIP